MQVNVILLRGNLDHGQVWIVAVFELKCPNHEEAKEESHGQAGHDCTDWCRELLYFTRHCVALSSIYLLLKALLVKFRHHLFE